MTKRSYSKLLHLRKFGYFLNQAQILFLLIISKYLLRYIHSSTRASLSNFEFSCSCCNFISDKILLQVPFLKVPYLKNWYSWRYKNYKFHNFCETKFLQWSSVQINTYRSISVFSRKFSVRPLWTKQSSPTDTTKQQKLRFS